MRMNHFIKSHFALINKSGSRRVRRSTHLKANMASTGRKSDPLDDRGVLSGAILITRGLISGFDNRCGDTKRRRYATDQAIHMFISVIFLLITNIANADAIKINGHWIEVGSVVGIENGILTYTVSSSGSELQEDLGRVGGLKIMQVPELTAAENALSSNKPVEAMASLAKVESNCRQVWIKHWAAFKFVQAAEKANKPVEAVDAFIRLVRENADAIYLANPPVNSVIAATTEQRREIAHRVNVAIADATGVGADSLKRLADRSTSTSAKTSTTLSSEEMPAPATPATPVTKTVSGKSNEPGTSANPAHSSTAVPNPADPNRHSASQETTDSLAVMTKSEGGNGQATVKELCGFEGHRYGVNSVAFSADGKLVLTGSQDKTARLWDAETWKEIRKFEGHKGAVTSVAFSPDRKRVLTGGEDAIARLWDTETGKELTLFEGRNRVASVAFSPDGKRVLTGESNHAARMWNVETGREIRIFEPYLGDKEDGYIESSIESVAFSPDGRQVLIGGIVCAASLWKADTGKEVRKFSTHGEAVKSVCISTDGKRVMTGSRDYTARIWDAATGKDIYTLVGHLGPVNSVAFSADGKLVLTGSQDKTARLWDAETWKEIRKFEGHKGAVTSVAFSPDRKRVLTGGEDAIARLWDTETGKELRNSYLVAIRSPTAKAAISSPANNTVNISISSPGKDEDLNAWLTGLGYKVGDLRSTIRSALRYGPYDEYERARRTGPSTLAELRDKQESLRERVNKKKYTIAISGYGVYTREESDRKRSIIVKLPFEVDELNEKDLDGCYINNVSRGSVAFLTKDISLQPINPNQIKIVEQADGIIYYRRSSNFEMKIDADITAAQADKYRHGGKLVAHLYISSVKYWDVPRNVRWYRGDALANSSTTLLDQSYDIGMNGTKEAPLVFVTKEVDNEDYVSAKIHGWCVVGSNGEILSKKLPERR